MTVLSLNLIYLNQEDKILRDEITITEVKRMSHKKGTNKLLNSFIILLLSAIIFLSPFIIIPTFLWIFNIFVPTVPQEKIKNITVFISEYGLKLDEYLYFFILFIQLVTTAVFSYVLWKTSLRSNELSEKIDEKDDNREKGLVRENALIVYYDLTLGLKDLAKLYESRIVKKVSPNPKRMFFSDEWIKNVAFLKDKLSNDEISVLYSLYGDLLIIKELLEANNSENDCKDLDNEIERLFKSIMNKNVIDYAYSFDLDVYDVGSYLNNRRFYIMEKLRLLTYKETQIVTKHKKDEIYQIYIDDVLYYEGNMKDNKLNGKGIIWNKNLIGKTYKRFEGRFVSGLFMEGLRQEEHAVDQTFFIMKFTRSNIRVSGQIYDKDGNILANGKYDDNGNPQEGFFTLFSDRGKVRYIGELKDCEYHGKGTLYEMDSIIKEGTWAKGKFIEGIEKNVRIADSEGFDYYVEQAYIEQKVQEIDARDEKIDDELYARSWKEYGSIQHKDGESRIIEKSRKREYEY